MIEGATFGRTIAVVTDSTADLPAGEFDRLHIHKVPLTVHWEGATYRDGIDLTTVAFYERLTSSRSLPTTAAPARGDFERLYRQLLESNQAVVSIHVGARFSGTWSVASTAAQNVDASRIAVLDSRTTTMCLGWTAAEAAKLSDQGAKLSEVVQHLERFIPRLRLFAAVDTLEFLQRGGRIGRVQALAGTLLRVKPLIQVLNGEVLPLERVRTHGAALRRLSELAADLPRLERLGVLHGAAPDTAQALVHALDERHLVPNIEVGEIGIVVGTHAGPGVFGFTALIGE